MQCNVIKVERKGILGNKRCFTLKMAPTIRSIESAADRRSILDSRYMQWLHENG